MIKKVPKKFYKDIPCNQGLPRVSHTLTAFDDIVEVVYIDKSKNLIEPFYLIYFTYMDIAYLYGSYINPSKQNLYVYHFFCTDSPNNIKPKLSLIKYLYKKLKDKDEFKLCTNIDLYHILLKFNPKFDIEQEGELYMGFECSETRDLYKFRLKKKTYTLKNFT